MDMANEPRPVGRIYHMNRIARHVWLRSRGLRARTFALRASFCLNLYLGDMVTE